MRADRLVAILLLLQSRGQVTAAEVAAELEVCERTARRDLEALGMAGLPVYSRQGRNGGWQLLGGARTDLSGLTAAEARALFLVAGPSSTATPDVKAALRKLVHALPEPFRVHAEAAATAIVSDPLGWGSTAVARPAPPALDDLQSAVIEAGQVRIGYTDRQRNVTERVVHPLGLATKGQIWYLVADTAAGLRTFRVDRISAVERTGEPAVRPPGFVLAEAWKLIADDVSKRRIGLWADGSATPGSLWLLRNVLGDRLRIGGTSERGANFGRVEVEIGGMDAVSLASSVAGFSAILNIDGPAEVRAELARIAHELCAMYVDQVGSPRDEAVEAGLGGLQVGASFVGEAGEVGDRHVAALHEPAVGVGR